MTDRANDFLCHNLKYPGEPSRREQLFFSDGSCWEIIIIKQIHTFTSNILFEQRRFGLGCPGLYQVKSKEENERGNPDRNVVAQTICCWWMCGFAWWTFFFVWDETNSSHTACTTQQPQHNFSDKLARPLLLTTEYMSCASSQWESDWAIA